MKSRFWVILIIFISIKVMAQDRDSTLRYDKKSKKVFLEQNELSLEDLDQVLKPYPESYKHLAFARESRMFARIFFRTGACPLGFTLGYFVMTRDFIWQSFAIGAGLVVIGIPLHIRFLKETEQAVDAFNERNDDSILDNNTNLLLGFNQNGISLFFRF